MCSTADHPAAARREPAGPRAPGPRDALGELGRLIDELADAASGRDVSPQELAGGLARAWRMLAELDPELARRLAGYGA